MLAIFSVYIFIFLNFLSLFYITHKNIIFIHLIKCVCRRSFKNKEVEFLLNFRKNLTYAILGSFPYSLRRSIKYAVLNPKKYHLFPLDLISQYGIIIIVRFWAVCKYTAERTKIWKQLHILTKTHIPMRNGFRRQDWVCFSIGESARFTDTRIFHGR